MSFTPSKKIKSEDIGSSSEPSLNKQNYSFPGKVMKYEFISHAAWNL